jgi:hypothetical protein
MEAGSGYVPRGVKLTSPQVGGIIYLRQLGSKVGVICPYVIVIELHKRHVIVFLSIFPAQGPNMDF